MVVTAPLLVYSRIFDEVMGCFCDSPPQSPTFPEAGHASLYDEDKVGWGFFSGKFSQAGSRAGAGCSSLAGSRSWELCVFMAVICLLVPQQVTRRRRPLSGSALKLQLSLLLSM